MKKFLVNSICAMTLAMAPMAISTVPAQANHEFWHAFGGAVAGAVVGGIIADAVVNGQRHCHEGLGCHAHGNARAYHSHDRYGSVIYARPVRQQRVYQEPVYEEEIYEEQPVVRPVVRPGRLPRAHYDWCLFTLQVL